jgi:hypothetical protein
MHSTKKKAKSEWKYVACKMQNKLDCVTFCFPDFRVGLSFIACFKEFFTELELWKAGPQEEMKGAVLL